MCSHPKSLRLHSGRRSQKKWQDPSLAQFSRRKSLPEVSENINAGRWCRCQYSSSASGSRVLSLLSLSSATSLVTMISGEKHRGRSEQLEDKISLRIDSRLLLSSLSASAASFISLSPSPSSSSSSLCSRHRRRKAASLLSSQLPACLSLHNKR